MKYIAKSITALALILLMTASLLASCGRTTGESSAKTKTVAMYDEYTAKTVDLGLAENEILMDIIEIDGKLRATIGVTSADIRNTYGLAANGTPYMTEYRYYSMDYMENEATREKTKSFHQVALLPDPNVDIILGGEPYLDTASITEKSIYNGVQYFYRRDGETFGKGILPPPLGEGNYDWDGDVSNTSTVYGARAHLMLHEDTVYTGISFDGGGWMIFIDDRVLPLPSWRPGMPEYNLCGLIGIDGIPYALVRVWEEDRNGQVVDILWEETRLVPLSPESTSLALEGTKIDGLATGGAFSDGKNGYFLCNSELWRTDGKESKRIADLIFTGISKISVVRSVRYLSDGRILVAADGGLIELSEAKESNNEQRKVYTIGVVNLYGEVSDLLLTVSKFNRIFEDGAYAVKEYRDKASLNLALLSGEVSMVVSMDQFMLKNYVNQDILAPLEEVAPELFEKDVLIESVVNATRINGTCYYLPRTFDIRGESTSPSILEEGQLFESRVEYYEFLTENDPNYFQARMKRDIFMYFAQDIDEWIDWESNTAHFDDGTFEALLEFCTQGGTQEDVDNYATNPVKFHTNNFVLMDSVQANWFTDVSKAKDYDAGYSVPEGVLYSNPAIVHFPIPSSVHDGYEMFVPHYFAVVDNDESVEAAAEFLRWHFLEDKVLKEIPPKELNSFPDGFSVNQEETDRYLRRNIDGFIEVSSDSNLDAIDKFYIESHNLGCGQEQYEITWAYIDACDHFEYFRNEVFDVMYEEAGRYFAGSISAKQAAEYTQNRISIYLAEQS